MKLEEENFILKQLREENLNYKELEKNTILNFIIDKIYLDVELENNFINCLKNFNEREILSFGSLNLFKGYSNNIKKYFDSYFFKKYKMSSVYSTKEQLEKSIFLISPSLTPTKFFNIKILKNKKELNDIDKNIYDNLYKKFKQPEKVFTF